MTSPITFNLGGVATDLPTLEAGLIALSIADPTSETVQGLLTFITTTEANPFHNPRALQQEILRLARTDPTILSVFMRTLSLQSGWKPQLSGKRFGSPQDALKQLRPDRGAERVDSQGAPVAEGTATVGGKREVWQAAGKVGAATSRYVSLNDERNAAKYIQNAREAERRGRVAGAHSLYAITLSLYYGLGDIAGAREAHEGMARTGIAILTKFFNDVIVPQIDRGDRERLKVNFSGFFTNMGFVEEHLWRTWALDPQKLSISMLESILFDERDGIAGQTLAWVAGILKAPDIVEAAREALPHLRELFPLLELTLRGRVNLLFERVDKLKTAGAADLTFIRKGYEYIRIFIRENILVEEQGPLLARVDNAISKMFEQGTQRTMPCKPVLWSPPVVEGYKGPRIIPFSTIALSQSETPNQRLERAALLKKKGGMENLQRAILLYMSVFHTYYRGGTLRQIMAVSKDLGRTHSQMARLLLEGINGLDDEIQKVAILRLVDFHFTGVKRYYDLLADALINHEGDRMEQAAPEERSAWLENVATILLARHRADLSGMGINNVLNGRLTFEGFADEINATYEDGGESVNLAATAHYLLFRRLTELGFVKMAGEEREKVRTMARPGSVLLIKIGAN